MAKHLSFSMFFALTICITTVYGFQNAWKSKDSCLDAYRFCKFTFKGASDEKVPSFKLDKEADRPFTPRIVVKSKGYIVKSLNSNKQIPEFINKKLVVPITKLGGNQKFSPTQFMPFTAKNGFSYIVYKSFQRNQKRIATNRCMRIYFTHLQVVHNGRITNVNGAKPSANNCIVFKTE